MRGEYMSMYMYMDGKTYVGCNDSGVLGKNDV